ncbi:hypothetical protein JOD64_001198 [Micromonospora luteifusca]|uniref:Uncharacterized protein n=1 Tax=Micromonospora luteifusca TaxID=709860 RepID=A0ABS2LP55_9ACTN|nr:hypothetical protein [Micromonospora luteifusca]MBM7489976.1 hypothetical protein [Micromonospora luteifusca]
MLQPAAELVRPAALPALPPLVSGGHESVLGSVVRGAGGPSRWRRGRVVG